VFRRDAGRTEAAFFAAAEVRVLHMEEQIEAGSAKSALHFTEIRPCRSHVVYLCITSGPITPSAAKFDVFVHHIRPDNAVSGQI
jgi:hypothetical protein